MQYEVRLPEMSALQMISLSHRGQTDPIGGDLERDQVVADLTTRSVSRRAVLDGAGCSNLAEA